jgi:hypothetical protein
MSIELSNIHRWGTRLPSLRWCRKFTATDFKSRGFLAPKIVLTLRPTSACPALPAGSSSASLPPPPAS